MKRLRAVGLAVVFAAVASCDFGPRAGELVWEVSMPHANTGGIAVVVVALEPNTVDTVSAACSGCRLFPVRVSEREMRGIVVGSIQPGPLISAMVSDVKPRQSYTAVVREAASTAFQPLAASGFQLVQQK